MSNSGTTPDPEVVVIQDKKDDCNVWMWAIFAIILVAIVLIIVGCCMSTKQCKQLVQMANNTSMPPSVVSSLQGGMRGGKSVAPVTQSMLNTSAAPMSFLSY